MKAANSFIAYFSFFLPYKPVESPSNSSAISNLAKMANVGQTTILLSLKYWINFVLLSATPRLRFAECVQKLEIL